METAQSSQPTPDPAAAPDASRRAVMPVSSRSWGDVAGAPVSEGHSKPRVKMISTSGDLNPAGATYTPPTTAPLPARGAGLHLFLSALAAIIAVVFFVLLAQKV